LAPVLRRPQQIALAGKPGGRLACNRLDRCGVEVDKACTLNNLGRLAAASESNPQRASIEGAGDRDDGEVAFAHSKFDKGASLRRIAPRPIERCQKFVGLARGDKGRAEKLGGFHPTNLARRSQFDFAA
jgi:hypothetical protein